MSAFNPADSLSFAVVMFLAVAVAVFLSARRRARMRVTELPNSHYTSHLVRNGEARHRWQGIVLERVHEANRDEVVRLLAKANAGGVDSLAQAERVFLDNVAGVPHSAAGGGRQDPGRPIASDLQHRPA